MKNDARPASSGSSMTTARAWLQRISSVEKSALLGLGLSAFFLYVFVQIADYVLDGGTGALDRDILLVFRNPADLSDPLGPHWLQEIMRDFTALGGVGVLALITGAVVGFFYITGRRHSAWMVAASIGGGVVVNNLLKWGFDRARPDVVPHIAAVFSQSFPSGHAMLSAIVYLTLGVLVARTQTGWRIKLYILSVATGLTVLIGVSRLYIGVHWPTDVLAGWTAGAAWALLCAMVMAWLQRGRKVEPATDTVNTADLAPEQPTSM